MPRPKQTTSKRGQRAVKLEADDDVALKVKVAQPPVAEELVEMVEQEEEEEEAEPDQCRVCTIRSDCFTYTNIFEKMIFKNVGIVEALTMVTSLEISRDDSLPPTICCRCEQRLLDAYHFRKLAESSARGFKKSITGKSPVVVATAAVAAAPAASLKRPTPPLSPKDAAVDAKKRKRDKTPQPIAPVEVEQPRRRGRQRQLTAAQQVAEERAQIKPTDNISVVAISSLQKTKTAADKTVAAEAKIEALSSYDRTEFEHFASEQLQLGVNNSSTEVVEVDEQDEEEAAQLADPALDDDQSMLVTLQPMTQANSFKIVYEEPASPPRQVLARRRPAQPAKPEAAADEDQPPQQLEIEEVELDEVLEEQEEELEDGDEEDGVSFLFNYNNTSEAGDDEQPAEEGAAAAAAAATKAADTAAPRSVRQVSSAEAEEAYLKRKHKCEVCGKRFFGRSNLVDHLRHHANVKPFKCTECDKAFVQKGSLTCHMRTHTQEKPFVCDVCDKCFSQASSRQIHMRTHTQERLYVCEHCSKAFYSNSDLSKHRRTHDEVKAYQCLYCEAGFAQRSNLRKHAAKKHAAQVAAAEKAADKAAAKQA